MSREISSRTFLTNLINSISSQPQGPSAPGNPLATVGEEDRKLLLTLHVLFPNELLPSLDLLDRRLVTRLSVAQQQEPEVEHATRPTATAEPSNTVYHVRSAQPKPSSSRFHDPVTASYEVRLTAWNCSCPAFAFAAFSSTLDDVGEEEEGGGAAGRTVEPLRAVSATAGTGCAAGSAVGGGTWLFGGLTRGEAAPPVCKHLLACVLAERCQLFTGFAEAEVTTVEGAAGRAAGWGG